MRTSPTKAASLPISGDRDAQQGFTLVEVMVAMVIISLTSALVVLNLPQSRESLLRDASERLAAQIKLSADMAVLSGNATGLQLSDTGYRLLRRGPTGWEPAPNFDQDLYLWPDRVRPFLSLEGEVLPLPLSFDGDIAIFPDIYFTATGDHPDFTLTLSSDQQDYLIQPGAYGQFFARLGGQG